MRKLRKFPKEVKALPICHILEERMREFKDSIPLFQDLKNEALRDRSVVHDIRSFLLLPYRVTGSPSHLCPGIGRN